MFILVYLGSDQAVAREAVPHGMHDVTLDLLLPTPHEMEAGTGHVSLGPSIRLSVPEKWAGAVDRYLWVLNEVLQARKAGPVTVVKEASAAAIRVVQKAQGTLPENGYELKIGAGVIDLAAPDPGGVFNGLATLSQLIELCGSETLEVPCGRIRDWPELATRAVHVDMTCQQYKAAYVQRLMRTLARYKVSAILMEYSDMFPFREHKAICRADAFSEDELQAIRRTAEECHQEIIPFLQCAGHLEYLLTREPYAELSEGHGGYSYCLANEAVLPFAESLIDEIVTQHPGLKRLHVGGDEVGPGTCQRCVSAGDFQARYLRHYARIAEYCLKRGIAPLLWTDVIAPFGLQKEPEAMAARVREAAQVLPHEVIGVDWSYYSKDFFVAPRMLDAGFRAFTAPAARCSGDLFDVPCVLLHMGNIQGGFLRAVELKLAGTIITSWSYRGSPHEVCLPEYACAAYGWNTHEADVPTLLKRFFRQRYGLSGADGAALARVALAETNVIVPTALARPSLDTNKRAWTIPATRQADQLTSRISKEDSTQLQASLESQMRQFAGNDALWQSALRSAKRHQRELYSWDLSRRHLQHRLALSLALARLKSGGKGEEQLDSLAEARSKLRDAWSEHYRDVFTPQHMEVELDIRFDAEPGIIEAVRGWEWKPTR
jgi:hypothetical protein